MVEIPPGELIEIVGPLARIEEIIGHHGVERDPPESHAEVPQDDEIVLHVLADLGDPRVLQQVTQAIDRQLRRQPRLVLRPTHGHVVRLPFLPAERVTHDLREMGLGRRRLGIQHHPARRESAR